MMFQKIPEADLKDRQLYRLHARNFSQGVYDAERHGFYGIREKFWSFFTDFEIEGHTAHALEERPEQLPAEIPLTDDLGTYCSICKRDCHFTPDDPSKATPGKWFHDDDNTLLENYDAPYDPKNPRGSPQHRSNTALFAWLCEMEEKYEPEQAAERKKVTATRAEKEVIPWPPKV